MCGKISAKDVLLRSLRHTDEEVYKDDCHELDYLDEEELGWEEEQLDAFPTIDMKGWPKGELRAMQQHNPNQPIAKCKVCKEVARALAVLYPCHCFCCLPCALSAENKSCPLPDCHCELIITFTAVNLSRPGTSGGASNNGQANNDNEPPPTGGGATNSQGDNDNVPPATGGAANNSQGNNDESFSTEFLRNLELTRHARLEARCEAARAANQTTEDDNEPPARGGAEGDQPHRNRDSIDSNNSVVLFEFNNTGVEAEMPIGSQPGVVVVPMDANPGVGKFFTQHFFIFG